MYCNADCTAGNEVCQTDGRSRSEASAESSLWPAMSIGKSVVLNYLMNSSEQTQLSTAGKLLCVPYCRLHCMNCL